VRQSTVRGFARAEAGSLGSCGVQVTLGRDFRILGYMEQKLCELCEGQQKKQNQRMSEPQLRTPGR
jgi:hypothetical protein